MKKISNIRQADQVKTAENPTVCGTNQIHSFSSSTTTSFIPDQTCRLITNTELYFLVLHWMLPILELGFTNKWLVQTGDCAKNFVTLIFILLRVIGAILIAISIFSFTGFLNRDE